MDTFSRLIWRCNSKRTVCSSVVLRDVKAQYDNLSDFLKLQEFYTQLKPELKAGGESIS